MTLLTSAIRLALEAAANPANAVQMQKYMKSQTPYRGVNAPAQRKIYAQAVKQYPVKSSDEYQSVIEELWDNGSYREEKYAAFYIADRYKKFQTLDALDLYRHLIVSGAWWDLVDGVASHLIGNLLQKHTQEMKKVLYAWIEDKDLWIRRTAILAQIRLKNETNWEMLKYFCEKCLTEESFWIRKAIGWALREYSKTNPSAVRDFVQQNASRMSTVSLREARKYI